MKQQRLFYNIIGSKHFNALVVLDEFGTIYYASIGNSLDQLKNQLVIDFKSSNQYQLLPYSTLKDKSLTEITIDKFKLLLEDPSRSEKFSIKFIFGTSLQRKVWLELMKIPHGEVTTYGDIARKLRMKPTSSRAIGGCIGANKIAAIVPCHRVIASNKTISGYRWGVEVKKYFLKHELGDSYDQLVN
ncbi:MGT1 [Candida pseudojiufengensis]|uniref:MGT1 n=1 Tax=Candida pseudojiufengensis TaxID=497109 RepID=UPI002225A145|nr:MGT1 [Candida pseudojiufengensis]KAI5965834.1 MGT1 [Candida pseudojiufengensis]